MGINTRCASKTCRFQSNINYFVISIYIKNYVFVSQKSKVEQIIFVRRASDRAVKRTRARLDSLFPLAVYLVIKKKEDKSNNFWVSFVRHNRAAHVLRDNNNTDTRGQPFLPPIQTLIFIVIFFSDKHLSKTL